MGVSQKQRSNEVFKAIATKSVLRLLALFKVGINVNDRNEYGQTPLAFAVWKRCEFICQLLIDFGARSDISDNAGIFPGQIRSAEIETMSHSTTISYTKISIADEANVGFIVDEVFRDDFMDQLLTLAESLPLAPQEKACSNTRAYFCDVQNIIIDALRNACETALRHFLGNEVSSPTVRAFPQMRFLFYRTENGYLAPHVDLSRTSDESDDISVTSTHTFILYLTDCEQGGATLMLRSVKSAPVDDNILTRVQPRKGRLLVFPHHSPHSGEPVVSLPKILLRGEIFIHIN